MGEEVIILILMVFGLIFGSFFCCMGYRIPNKMSTVMGKSICPKCRKELKWYMKVPVLSFIFLGGKCAYCKKPIDFIYPFVEITTALLFVANYVIFGFGYEFIISMIITGMLMVTVVSDFIYFYISDRVLVIGSILSFSTMFYYFGFNYAFNHLISGIIIFIIMLLIKYIGNYFLKKECIGDGDLKLMGCIGIILGLTNSFVCLFIGSLLGLIFSLIISKKNKEGIIPFGPFLLMGALICMYFSSFIDMFIDKLIFV